MAGEGIEGLRGGGCQRYKHAPLTQFDSWPYTLEEKQQPLTCKHAVLPLTHISFFLPKAQTKCEKRQQKQNCCQNLLLFAD